MVPDWRDSGNSDGARQTGLTKLWQRIVNINIEGRWYLYAIGMALMLVMLPLLLFGITSGFTPAVSPFPMLG